MRLLEKLYALLHEGTLPVMLPLILVCLGIGVLIVERCLYLYDPRVFSLWPGSRRRVRREREHLMRAFGRYVEDQGEENRAALAAACRSYQTPYSRFLLRALREEGTSAALLDLELDDALLREEIAIERGMHLLSTFSKVAPLLGLLGTVTGMIHTFGVMMVASTTDPRALSSGISIALIATLVGLVVAMPGVIGMSLLSRRGKTLEEEIHLASMQMRTAHERAPLRTELAA